MRKKLWLVVWIKILMKGTTRQERKEEEKRIFMVRQIVQCLCVIRFNLNAGIFPLKDFGPPPPRKVCETQIVVHTL